MVALFSIAPMGTGVRVAKEVTDAIRVVEESGLDYQVTAMGTLIEGDWDEVMGVIRACFDVVHEHSERVTCFIKIDDWVGKRGQIRNKVASVEELLGHELPR